MDVIAQAQTKLITSDLVPLNAFEKSFPIVNHLAYADSDYRDNHFKGLYHPEARVMWAHKDIAAVTLLAAKICHDQFGWTLEIKDCLRPVEAQEKMMAYGYDETLVSTPGNGAHPRAMAIDICPIDKKGRYVDMGTPFDYFVEDPKSGNPAARHYTHIDESLQSSATIWSNRSNLEFAMRAAATSLGMQILPLSQEWWDFRFEPDLFNQYAPLREADLEPYQRLISPDLEGMEKILEGVYPEKMGKTLREITLSVNRTFDHIRGNARGNNLVADMPGRPSQG